VNRLLAIFLAVAVLPAAGVSPESSGVVIHEGESDVHQHEPEQPGSERGCSVLFHVCSCHTSVSSTPASARAEIGTGEQKDQRYRRYGHDAGNSRIADPPPLPPPIA
jgi:hypothetical protein